MNAAALRYANAERAMEMARRARSLRGRQIPDPLIKTIGTIALTGIDLVIGTKKTLSKKFVFFLEHHSHLKFYDQSGEEFMFSDYADSVRHHEIFMAIDFDEYTERGQVFMFFPTDAIA